MEKARLVPIARVPLTDTENEICDGYANGLTLKEIAFRRRGSKYTVRNHTTNILCKMKAFRLPGEKPPLQTGWKCSMFKSKLFNVPQSPNVEIRTKSDYQAAVQLREHLKSRD